MKLSHIFALVSVARLVSAHYNSTGYEPDRQPDECDKLGAVASESAVCSRIGIELLQAGGNAADAVSETISHCPTLQMYFKSISRHPSI